MMPPMVMLRSPFRYTHNPPPTALLPPQAAQSSFTVLSCNPKHDTTWSQSSTRSQSCHLQTLYRCVLVPVCLVCLFVCMCLHLFVCPCCTCLACSKLFLAVSACRCSLTGGDMIPPLGRYTCFTPGSMLGSVSQMIGSVFVTKGYSELHMSRTAP